MGHRRWLPAVAIHRLGVVEIALFSHGPPLRSRLIARQQSQSSPDPAGKDSATSSPILTEAGTSVRLSFQELWAVKTLQYDCHTFINKMAHIYIHAINFVIVVSFLVPPTIKHISPDVTASVGDVITLVCRASGKPSPTITWSKYGPYDNELISTYNKGVVLDGIPLD